MLVPNGFPLEPLWKKEIRYKKVAFRHAGWRNRAPATESTHVNKKGKWKEDLHLASCPLYLLVSFSFISPFFFPFFLFSVISLFGSSASIFLWL
jgi:hypothetical protein